MARRHDVLLAEWDRLEEKVTSEIINRADSLGMKIVIEKISTPQGRAAKRIIIERLALDDTCGLLEAILEADEERIAARRKLARRQGACSATKPQAAAGAIATGGH